MKDYNVKIDGRNFFDQPINDDRKTYENIRKLLLVKKMIAQVVICYIIDPSKQQTLDTDPRAFQQINFTGTLARKRNVNTAVFLIVKETKEILLDFSEEPGRSL